MMPADHPARSFAELVASWDAERQASWIAGLTPAMARALPHIWWFWERPGQRPPPPPWRVWLVMAGRGFGKTRMGAEWIRAQAESTPRLKIALVGATAGEVRRVMVEGESGLLAIAPPELRPRWEPSLGKLRWATGSEAFVYAASEPEALRGPTHHLAWADEIAKWPQGEVAWDNLQLTLRAGRWPRVVATTTPRPVPLVRRLVAAQGVAITKGRSRDNRAHLADGFLAAMAASYGGTRLGRQELDGELIEEVAGALWTRAGLEACRVRVLPALVRVVVAVDPAAGRLTGEAGDLCGIVAVALGRDGKGYVLEDASVATGSTEGWARAVAACAARHGADRVIAEANNGGQMVGAVLRAAEAGLPLSLVHASAGKSARAEPVATLYERGMVRHLGAFPALEDELCGMVAGGGYAGPGRSPDRADALIWGVTELMLGTRGEASLRML